MSDDNRVAGPTHIYNIPQSAYQNYAKTEEKLAETRKMQGEQGASVARRCALIDVVIKPSAFDTLFGLWQKAAPIKVDLPPGFTEQLSPLNVNGETLFGAPSHLESLKATVTNAPGEPEEKTIMNNFLGVVIKDLTAKNSVLARRGSLQQG
ncbi:MAG: hypothetical protein WCN87_01805 [Chlamydiota bacterium]